MQIQPLKLAAVLLALNLLVTSASADEATKEKTHTKKEAAAEEALRLKVEKNIASVNIDPLHDIT